MSTDPVAAVERLVRAMKTHDPREVAACFADDYRLEVPAHPARSFEGRAQVLENYTRIFAAVPDLVPRVLRYSVAGRTIWTEWELSGTRVDGAEVRLRGVFIFEVEGAGMRYGRMYVEPVDTSGADIRAAIGELLGTPPGR